MSEHSRTVYDYDIDSMCSLDCHDFERGEVVERLVFIANCYPTQKFKDAMAGKDPEYAASDIRYFIADDIDLFIDRKAYEQGILYSFSVEDPGYGVEDKVVVYDFRLRMPSKSKAKEYYDKFADDMECLEPERINGKHRKPKALSENDVKKKLIEMYNGMVKFAKDNGYKLGYVSISDNNELPTTNLMMFPAAVMEPCWTTIGDDCEPEAVPAEGSIECVEINSISAMPGQVLSELEIIQPDILMVKFDKDGLRELVKNGYKVPTPEPDDDEEDDLDDSWENVF